MGRDGQGHDRLGGSIQSSEARRLSSCRESRNALARSGHTRRFDRTELGRNERCTGEGGSAVAETTNKLSSGRQTISMWRTFDVEKYQTQFPQTGGAGDRRV